ncbi:hypothetical protein K3163_05565 [Qipengyuania sp. 1NDW9]|uniref:hypothetical protein n=1 Tax=Qipengyuania xiapuensis TaxID=2867236 RepID=UPI001C87CAB7|nr:hypothetical protein [Qipengyuania xiapuensis]MBX7492670.1 hypothetical protein [Qipengyuania xiapuensis]
MSKYKPEEMMPVFRHFWQARNEALELGFTDNGGAIHSAERIAEMMARHHVYGGRFGAGYKLAEDAHCSVAARDARQAAIEAGTPRKDLLKTVEIEHVLPVRAMTREIGALVDAGATDAEVLDWLSTNFRMVLLTPDERKAVDARNRSEICPDRLAGIDLHSI